MTSPFRLTQIYQALTSKNPLLKKKLKLGTDEIPIPPKRKDVIDIEAINRFNKDNPRVDTTQFTPFLKQSNIKQSNVSEPNEGVIQGAYDTATREAQQSGYPAPSYDKFKSRYLKKNMKADGGRIGYRDGEGVITVDDKIDEMISFYKDYLNQGGKMDFKTFSNKYIPQNFADGGRIGFSTGKLAGGMDLAIAENKALEERIARHKRMTDMLNKKYEDKAHGPFMTPMPVPMEDVMQLDRPSKSEIEVGPYSPEAGSGDFGAEDIYAVFDDGTIYYKDTGEFYNESGKQVDGPSPGAKLKVPTMEAADGGRAGYKDGLGPNDQPMGPVYTTNKIEDAAKEVVKRLIKLDGVDIPLTDKISMSLGPDLNRTEINGVIDILGGELNFGGGIKGDDKGIGFSFRREFQDGGMLVKPSDDGSRPGYKEDKFTVGSGPGTGDALTSDRNTKIVKQELNKIKKQINNKLYFEWSEKSDWYKKLQSKLGGKAEGVGMNRDFTNQLINKVVNENFPGSYHGRSAISNLRKDMVVNGFVEYLKDNREFDGGEKFLKSLEKFTEGKDIDHKYSEINKAWKSWIAGEFEVEGVDRTQLAKELEARDIDYNKIDDWSANSSQKRGLKKKAAIEFLDKQNNNFPNRSFEDVEKLYKQKFPDRNIYLDVNTLTDIKRTGIYKSGDSTTSKYKSVLKGNRANWLKESYGKQFQGNYSKLIQAADQLEAAGEFKKAKRISDAADKFFGPNGIITKAKGEGEHALARLFDVYGKPDINGNILPNPNRQLAINSLVSGDLNQFKKNFFDVPVKRLFDEYNNPETTAARRKELKTLIEDRKKTMNSLTGGQTKGIVSGDTVKFQYTPDKIIATSNVEALDTKFKKGEFDIQEYLSRGNSYDEAFKIAGSEANIFTKTGDIKSTYSKPINEKKANILSAFCNSKRKGLKLAGSVDGLTCSMEEIQTNMQKQIDQAAKASKNGRIPPKFGKLTAFAKTFFGDVAIPLEYMFAAPYLAAGDIEGAKRASTAGLLGYGKVDLDKLPKGEG